MEVSGISNKFYSECKNNQLDTNVDSRCRMPNYIWASCGAVKWELLSCCKVFLAAEPRPTVCLFREHLQTVPWFSLGTGNASVEALLCNCLRKEAFQHGE